MKYLLPLLLTGCAYIPTIELENQLFACDNAHAEGCDLLRAEVEKRYINKQRRENCKECPVNGHCYSLHNGRLLRHW